MTKTLKQKMKEVEKGFGITAEEKSRTLANDHIIDCDKRKRPFEEPKFTT